MPLEELNLIDGRLFQHDNHWAHFRRLREEDPLHFNELPGLGRYWSVTKIDDIMYVDTHHNKFSSASGIAIGASVDQEPDPNELQFTDFIAMDPPTHDLHRKTMSGVVTPTNLAKLESLIRQRVQAILDSLPVGKPFNWVEHVSIELTTQMLSTLFDFPLEDRHKLTRWSDVATAPPGTGIVDKAEKRKQELYERLAYFKRLWNERAAKEPGSDLISLLAHGENTRNMKPHELLGMLVLLIVGGNGTTRNSISAGVWALNQFPEQFAKLKSNPALFPFMVSEIIRWHTPLPYMRRTATQDVELNSKRIKTGDQVLMWYVSGNRDPDALYNPDDFIIDRPQPRHHLSFGFGIHRCMGNRLAEMQLRILWEEILTRFDNIETLSEPVRLRSSFVRGITELQVPLTPL